MVRVATKGGRKCCSRLRQKGKAVKHGLAVALQMEACEMGLL